MKNYQCMATISMIASLCMPASCNHRDVIETSSKKDEGPDYVRLPQATHRLPEPMRFTIGNRHPAYGSKGSLTTIGKTESGKYAAIAPSNVNIDIERVSYETLDEFAMFLASFNNQVFRNAFPFDQIDPLDESTFRQVREKTEQIVQNNRGVK